jgi:hypothetical protein
MLFNKLLLIKKKKKVLLAIKRHGWQIICSFLMEIFSGIYLLSDLCKIER